ncbi:MAG: hypothetical protein LBT14_10000 [Treponema sp.]|jgi:hypothetical protein|nr:hypothetical protein [Treponema sp.]
MNIEFGKDWWNLGVLYDDQKRDLPDSGDNTKLLNSLDIQRCLLLFDLHWQRVFHIYIIKEDEAP